MKKLLLLFCIAFTLVACHNDEPQIPEAANRTVLVYMIADNTLAGNVEANVDSMMSGYKATKEAANLIVYVDEAGKTPVLFKLEKNSNGSVSKTIIKNYPEQNSVDVTVMQGVLSDVFNNFRADSYGLILWSHGYSWVPSSSTKTISTRWFGQDNATKTQYDSNNFMDITDLNEALSVAPKFDFILFDACLMSGVEVAYELKDRAEYIIAAPTEIIDLGFPYNRIVEPMFGSKDNFKELAIRYFDYYNAMNGLYKSATIAMIKCSEMGNLAMITKNILAAHKSEFSTLPTTSIQLYDRVGASSHFAYDFGQLIGSVATSAEQSALQKQLDATVVYKATTDYFIDLRIDPLHFSGLGAYIPRQEQTAYNIFFKTLSWYQAAGWDQIQWSWE
ncbi:clostripain-related cysteine peptidase [Bacteroides sedimenti]